jgi:hypothetical protein
LFIAFLAVFLVIRENSFFNKYLHGEQSALSTTVKGIGLGLFFSLLFLIKLNFYFFAMFLGLYFLFRLFERHISDFKRVAARAGVILLVIAAVFSLTQVLKEEVNNWDRAHKMLEMRYKTAKGNLNSLLNPKETSKYSRLKDKGYPISHVWEDMQWGHITFMSSFGVFGNMSIYNSQEFYQWVWFLLILTMICIVYDLMFKRNSRGDLLCFFLVVFCACSLLGADLYHSWVADFQAQGRYLLPIVPMLGGFLYSARRSLSLPRINFFALLLFLASCDSFILLGLKNILPHL